MTPIKSILVPVDFSQHSAAAVDLAIQLAPLYAASIELLYVYVPISHAIPAHYVLVSPEQEDLVIGRFQELLDGERKRAKAEGASSLEATLLIGAVRERIVDYATQKKHDLIVLGTHGRTGFRHLLLGSVAESVIRRAPCPVATVRAPQAP
jgi:universal stress protein A